MLIRELIHIPDQVNRGDFVLKLAEGVQDQDHARQTVQSYVVTDQLLRAFGNAMNFIEGAVQTNQSKAAYLHGSFGSGKSHFMAILHLLLQQSPLARGIRELAPVVQKNDAWIQGRKFLLVPYHMIGSESAEQGILGGYDKHIQKLHPDAPRPAVYRAEKLFADAEQMRQRIGDEAFLKGLGVGAGGGGWGQLSQGWDLPSYEAARNAPAGDNGRRRLVEDLVTHYYPGYGQVQRDGQETYVDLDEGLAVLSQHAQALGYDAVVLFLDELILWLAGHAANVGFVQREVQKLAKLVEAQNVDRPIPLVSFIARQRDLRDLVGHNAPGAGRMNFSDALAHWEGRFHQIELADRNLPEIAGKRLLRTKNDQAHQTLQAEFEKTKSIRQEIMDILLTDEGDRDTFRKVYPFSPALVETLVAVSSLLQRERTALKVMMQLLVDQRDTLELGQIIPVGDLFDAVTEGDEAFSDEMKVHFGRARKLYDETLLPMLESDVGLTAEEATRLPVNDGRRKRLENEQRLIKTMLLAALVPEVRSLKDLTATRLTALNWGTIKTPFGGGETKLVAERLRKWAAACSQIKLDGDVQTNPRVSVHLAGVDTEAILKAAEGQDSLGNRVQKIQELVFGELGLDQSTDLFRSQTDRILWRGTSRQVDLVFQNLREMAPASLNNEEDRWKIIIDWPVDDEDHGRGDDNARIEQFHKMYPQGGLTLVWSPAFLSEKALRDLGKLVVISHVLKGDNFDRYATRLSPAERPVAKMLLEGQRDQLTVRVKQHLEAAYGIRHGQDAEQSIRSDDADAEVFRSLKPGFTPRVPAAANLRDSYEDLVRQALAYQFPAHPQFEEEIRPAKLKKVLDVVIEAANGGQRAGVGDRATADLMRRIAQPLKLGQQGSTHFALEEHWKVHLNKKLSASGQDAATVGQVKQWLDDPQRMGLPDEVANLVVIAFALQTNRSFYEGRRVAEPSVTGLDDRMELRPEPLPDPAAWERGLERAQGIFGVTAPKARNAQNAALLSERIREQIEHHVAKARKLFQALRMRVTQRGLTEKCTRLEELQAVLRLADALEDQKPADLLKRLAAFDPQYADQALGASLNADRALSAIEATQWDLFDTVQQIPQDHALRSEARETLDQLDQVLAASELTQPLAPALQNAQQACLSLTRRFVTSATPPPPPPPRDPEPGPAPTPPPPSTGAGWQSKSAQKLSLPALQKVVAELKGLVETGHEVEIEHVVWRVKEPDKT